MPEKELNLNYDKTPSMDTSKITIETKNLRLKSITPDYAEDIFKEFSADITTFMLPKPANKIEETQDFIEKSIAENQAGRNFQIVILDKKNNFLGCGGLHHPDTKTPELGVWIKKSAHGHGYGKEAMVALKNWADENLDYEYILYPVDEKNSPSRKIPESLGGQIAREYDHVNQSGNKLRLIEYRIYPPKK